MEGLKTSEVARLAGVNLQTIHYYERRGLLSKPSRTHSNYRAYSLKAVERIRFIKRAQELGFTLKEIKELLSLQASPRARCADVYNQAKGKIGDIDEKMRTLQAMRGALSKLMRQCIGRSPVSECPILEMLDSE